MRTAPLALVHLDGDPGELMATAGVLSALTHADADAQEACGLWCVAIREAVLTGRLDIRVGLPLMPPERAAVWVERIEVSERSRPRDFSRNGCVVEAFQGAWSAIHFAGLTASGPAHLRAALEEAVHGGRDTDTVAAIAGGLLGAAYGYTAVPFEWRRRLHDWPGLRARDLMMLAMELGRGEGRRPAAWPRAERQDYSMWGRTDALVRHPHDDGVWLGGVRSWLGWSSWGSTPWCRCAGWGLPMYPAWRRRIMPRSGLSTPLLEGQRGTRQPPSNASAPKEKTVLLHCVRAESRTPTVAALYGAQIAGFTPLEALEDVRRALPGANPNELFFGVA